MGPPVAFETASIQVPPVVFSSSRHFFLVCSSFSFERPSLSLPADFGFVLRLPVHKYAPVKSIFFFIFIPRKTVCRGRGYIIPPSVYTVTAVGKNRWGRGLKSGNLRSRGFSFLSSGAAPAREHFLIPPVRNNISAGRTTISVRTFAVIIFNGNRGIVNTT